MPKNYPLYINGKWVEKEKTYEVVNPYSGEIVALLSKPDLSDVEAAVISAEKGFHKMRSLHTYERFEIMVKEKTKISDFKRDVMRNFLRVAF